MNIETKSKIDTIQTINVQQTSQQNQNDGSTKFSDELKNAANKTDSSDEKKETPDTNDEKKVQEVKQEDNGKIENTIGGLEDAVEEINKLNRTDEKPETKLKSILNFDDKDNKIEDLGLIDNNLNIQEPKDKLNTQMGTNMNFNSNGQPFAEFVNKETKNVLQASSTDLAEEKAILSSMEENIAIANKNIALSDNTGTVINDKGIKKVNKDTNMTIDTVVKFDTVIMDKNDVEFFANLVNEGSVNLHEVTNASHASAVSKTLADLLAKSMQENKPVRIDFDNDISVIIKISKDGKISADFLPSSNVAEAYLRENLPLLKQKFDDNNIDYEELNQRKQKQNENDNRRKDRKDE